LLRPALTFGQVTANLDMGLYAVHFELGIDELKDVIDQLVHPKGDRFFGTTIPRKFTHMVNDAAHPINLADDILQGLFQFLWRDLPILTQAVDAMPSEKVRMPLSGWLSS
jgi:hypothetical protein